MEKKINKEKMCEYCKNKINIDNDRYVSLLTNDGKKLIEETYFHIKCWQDYFNDKIIQRVQKGQKMAMNLMGNLFNKIHSIPNIKNEA